MSDNRREQERAELYKSIWAIANDLRGSVDGWDFKNYVLTTLFYRYISENLTNYINQGEREAGDESFDYAKMSDEDAAILWILVIVGELQQKLESGEISQEEYDQAMAELGL